MMSQPTGRSVICQSLTKELNVDYRKQGGEHSPIHINGETVEQVDRFKYIGVQITKDLKFSKHTRSREEGATVPLPPQEVEKVWHGPSNPQKVLKVYH